MKDPILINCAHFSAKSTRLAFALSFALFVLTNAEFPRLGLIRVDSFDHFLAEALAKMR